MKTLQLDHIGLHVADVDTSGRFYGDVLALEPLPRPAFDFPGAWFRIGTHQELHLIAGIQGQPSPLGGASHFAIAVDDLDAWYERLTGQGVEVRRQVRPDGVGQLYVADPDGHMVEICEAVAPNRR
jgi:catechol 2,3-dioxygenase-like lactoylglutathione lyase family enzyme